MIPLQAVSEVSAPWILTTLVAMIVALVIVRCLLKVALWIAIVAALVVGVLRLFGSLHLFPAPIAGL